MGICAVEEEVLKPIVLWRCPTPRVQFLVELGIDPISVTPDSLLRTIKAIAEVEAKVPIGNGVKAEA